MNVRRSCANYLPKPVAISCSAGRAPSKATAVLLVQISVRRVGRLGQRPDAASKESVMEASKIELAAQHKQRGRKYVNVEPAFAEPEKRCAGDDQRQRPSMQI